MISWIICETIVTYFLIDTEQSETPPIHLNKCEPNETCIIHWNKQKKWKNLYIFQNYIKNIYHFTPNMWNTLQPFVTNVKHAHLIETYMILMWTTFLPFETYVKYAHHITTYMKLMWNTLHPFESNVKNAHPFETYMTLMRNTLLLF
jgi:hypothetical protein